MNVFFQYCVCPSFPFGITGGMLDEIVLTPYHCLSIYFDFKNSICCYCQKDINFFQEISHCHNKYEAIPIVLLGNKADLEDKRQVRLKDGIKVS